ncbi:MAG: hypothetical protein AB2L11_05405 [Syntrophobacteraceae bacterium]
MVIHRYKFIGKIIAFCLLLPVLFSCASPGKAKKNNEGLVAAVQNLNTAIRWQEYNTAAYCMASPLRERFWTLTDGLQKSVRILDFEIRRSSCDELSLSGEATLCYRYYHTDSPQLQTKTVHERYRYSEKEEAWQMVQHDLESLLP